MTGKTYGMELWGAWDVRDWWRLSGGATYIGKDFKLKPGSLDVANFEAAGLDPDGWVKLRSQFQLSPELSLDVGARVFDDVPTSRASGYLGTPAFAEVDARLAWRVNEKLELSLATFNLLHDQHAEAAEARRSEPTRSAYLGLRWAY